MNWPGSRPNYSRVCFELRQHSDRLHQLTNNGTHAAYGVTIDHEGNVFNYFGKDDAFDGEFAEFAEGHAEMFFAMGFGTEFITISWHNDPGKTDDRKSQRLSITP